MAEFIINGDVHVHDGRRTISEAFFSAERRNQQKRPVGGRSRRLQLLRRVYYSRFRTRETAVAYRP